MQNTGKVVLAKGVKTVDRGKRIDIYVPEGESMTLNSSGADLFRALMKNQYIEQAINEICDMYDAERDEIESDANEFLDFLFESGVLSLEQGE